MSIVTMMELILSAGNRKEVESIRKFFRKTKIVNINE
jgi:hypothetical protein